MVEPTVQQRWNRLVSDTPQSIMARIQNMGYIPAIPVGTPIPSYYELGDGTVLGVLARVNHILIKGSGMGAVNHSMDVMVFAPRRDKHHPPAQPNRPPTIVDQDVKCTALREEFNDYNIGSDLVVSAKAVVAQVAVTDLYNNEGEPIYNINAQPIIKVVDKRQQPFTPDMR